MLSSTLIVVAALAVASLANPVSELQPGVDYGNANLYIDLVLFNVNRKLPKVVPIPDIGGPFDMKNCFFLGTQKGIKRDGDATLVTTGRTVKFQSVFKMQNVGITCDWHYMLMSGVATGTTAKVDISSGMALVMAQGQHPWLTEFRVTTMEPIKTDITGLTVAFNWLAEDIANWMLGGLTDMITSIVEVQVRDYFQSVLNNMVIP